MFKLLINPSPDIFEIKGNGAKRSTALDRAEYIAKTQIHLVWFLAQIILCLCDLKGHEQLPSLWVGIGCNIT